MLHVIIEPGENNPGLPMQVDETTPVDSLIARLVAQLHCPRVDASGLSLWYSLRKVSSSQHLSPALRLAESRIVNGTRLVLEAHAEQRARSSFWQITWTRRQAASFVGLCIAGLGSGLGTSWLQVRGQRSALAQTTSNAEVSPLRAAAPLFTFAEHQATVNAVAWSPQGSQLASGSDDKTLQIWTSDGNVQQQFSHPASVRALAWSPGGDRVASGASTDLTLFNALSGTVLGQAQRHTAPITSLAWALHGHQQLVSAAQDKLAIVWSPANVAPVTIFARHDTPIEAASWGPDGASIATSSDGGAIRYWFAQTGQEIHPAYQDAAVPMRALAFAPLDFRLTVGGDDGILRMYHQTQQCLKTGLGVDGVICLDTPQRFSLSSLPVFASVWSPDGHYLATGHGDGTVAIWNGQTLQKLFTFLVASETPVRSLSWSPAGNTLATAAGKLIVLWNLHA